MPRQKNTYVRFFPLQSYTTN